MDQSQVAVFKSRYSLMSDDELVYLMAAKFDHLTEEAQLALQAAVKSRGIAGVQAEIAATASDLAGQARYEEEEERKRVAQKASERKFLLLLCALFVVVGLALAAAKDAETGLGMSGVAVAIAVFYELRRLLGKLVSAMFRMD